jgi:4-hydroxy-tetrahydrodipicolinate reductase
MMKFAMEAAKYFDKVEIIELHHDGKADAPSGTALRTAELILKARGKPFPEPKVKKPEVLLDGVLGGEMDGIRIHSVRLPGFGSPPRGHLRDGWASFDNPPRFP